MLLIGILNFREEVKKPFFVTESPANRWDGKLIEQGNGRVRPRLKYGTGQRIIPDWGRFTTF